MNGGTRIALVIFALGIGAGGLLIAAVYGLDRLERWIVRRDEENER